MSNHRYSYSQLSVFAECPIKYKYRYVDALVPLGGENEHDLRFGKAYDAALNTWYLGGTLKEARHAFATSYPADEYPDPLPYYSPGKSFNGGLAAIGQYVEHWKEEDQWWEVVSVQARVTTETDDRTVVLDLVVRDKRDGLIYGVDNKTTGKYLDKDYWLRFDPHSQIRQYVDHLQKKYGEVGGFYINATSLRHRLKAVTPRQGPNKGVLQPAGDWCDFKRMCFNPNGEAVQAERDNFLYWVIQIERSKQNDVWGYNTSQCVKGSIVCPYHKICSAGYTWPREADLITNYYKQQCTRLAGDGNRCQLLPGHEGEHDSTRVGSVDAEVDLNEIEEAVSADE